jgi:hypothetical protein
LAKDFSLRKWKRSDLNPQALLDRLFLEISRENEDW